MDKNKNTTGCSGCSCCSMRADVGEPKMSGLKLVICAFLVFVLPLLNMAIAAGISYQHYGYPVWATILVAFMAAGITISVVRIITRHIQPDSNPPSILCRKET